MGDWKSKYCSCEEREGERERNYYEVRERERERFKRWYFGLFSLSRERDGGGLPLARGKQLLEQVVGID